MRFQFPASFLSKKGCLQPIYGTYSTVLYNTKYRASVIGGVFSNIYWLCCSKRPIFYSTIGYLKRLDLWGVLPTRGPEFLKGRKMRLKDQNFEGAQRARPPAPNIRSPNTNTNTKEELPISPGRPSVRVRWPQIDFPGAARSAINLQQPQYKST